MTAVAKREDSQVISAGGSLIDVISRAASDPATDVEKMEKLMGMYERIMERQARAAYMAALADMQLDLPEIPENGKGHGNIKYALWEDINELIRPVLGRHGFSLSFRTGQQDGKISVTGVLSHREGHSEETTMHLPTDSSGSKNAVQAVGSSTSYGKRYTAQALLNLTSRNEDDDGKASGVGETISDAQVKQLRDLIDSTGSDIEKFCKYLRVASIPELPTAKFKDALAALNAKKGTAK